MLPRSFAALAALTLVLGACSSTTPVAGERTGTPSTSTSVSPTPSPGAPTGGTGGSMVDPDASGDPQVVTPGGGNGAPADGPVGPPAAGNYRYTQDGETTFGPFTFEPDTEGTLVIDEPSSRGGTTRQFQTRTYSSNESRESLLEFRGDGVYLLSLVTRFATTERSCTLDRPLLVIELPATVGASWSDTSTCDDLRLRVNGSVLRTEVRTVGGQRIDTVVIKTVVRATGENVDQTARSTTWIAPADRLIVRSTQRAEGTLNGTPFTQRLVEELVSLTPGR